MKIIWSVLCQKHTTNQEDNLLNLFGCITNILYSPSKDKIKDLKIIPAQIELVNSWLVEEVEKDEFLEYKIEFLDPNKKVLSVENRKVKILKNKINFRDCNIIRGIKFTKNGLYSFNISKKDGEKYKKINEIPLRIIVKERNHEIKK